MQILVATTLVCAPGPPQKDTVRLPIHLARGVALSVARALGEPRDVTIYMLRGHSGTGERPSPGACRSFLRPCQLPGSARCSLDADRGVSGFAGHGKCHAVCKCVVLCGRGRWRRGGGRARACGRAEHEDDRRGCRPTRFGAAVCGSFQAMRKNVVRERADWEDRGRYRE
ncbi:hypothetical protein OBBRIDRAFT_173332 [Obba rivulosa]|uniref:Uncharacterized protein n=1 Tax=Obba rivulosa TaxID=1052685 RepID=A0A8E2ASB3_9APHY|nr:hypothetical protein OBBRIDRAFT_173332 [Obba rivulosa]